METAQRIFVAGMATLTTTFTKGFTLVVVILIFDDNGLCNSIAVFTSAAPRLSVLTGELVGMLLSCAWASTSCSLFPSSMQALGSLLCCTWDWSSPLFLVGFAMGLKRPANAAWDCAFSDLHLPAASQKGCQGSAVPMIVLNCAHRTSLRSVYAQACGNAIFETPPCAVQKLGARQSRLLLFGIHVDSDIDRPHPLLVVVVHSKCSTMPP